MASEFDLHRENNFSWSYIYFYTLFILISAVNLIRPAAALYEDQVGKFDWRKQFIGSVVNAHFEASSGNRRIIVSTEENVIAAVNFRNGQILWRQILEPGKAGFIHSLAVNNDEVISVSGSEPVLIRNWDPASGFLNSEIALPDHNPEGKTVIEHFRVENNGKSLLGVEVFTSDSAYVIFKRYNIKTADTAASKRISTPWFNSKTSCRFVGDAYFVCYDHQSSSIHLLSLESFVVRTISLVSLGITSSYHRSGRLETVSVERNLFVLILNDVHFALLKAAESGIQVVKVLQNVVALTTAQVEKQTLLFTATTSEIKVSDFETDEPLESLTLSSEHGEVDKLFVYMIPKKDGGFGYRLLLNTKSHSLVLLRHPGEEIWVRDESLASILTVEMVDLPVSEIEVQFEEQFGMVNSNLAVTFLRRLSSQLLQLQMYLSHVLLSVRGETNPLSGSNAVTEKEKLIRDEFNIHKVLVVVTSVGKVFGIDNLSGAVIWKNYIRELEPFDRNGKRQLLLYVQRTSMHYPHLPQCVVLGRNKLSQNGLLYVFDPITGKPLSGEDGVIHLSYPVVQAFQLPFLSADFVKGLLLMDNSHKVHVYPQSSASMATQNKDSLYMFLAEAEKGELQGFNFAFSTNQELTARKTWSLSFPLSTQSITNVVMKRNAEHVHSQGRVMGDRSVLYKYLNPNLAVVTTEGYNALQKYYFNVYLLDVVTGEVIFSTNHKRCKGPIHIVHSENWITYSYFNERHRRMEISVLELYEGKSQTNTTAFSSFSPPPSPMIERQAYIFPLHIDATDVTLTEKGITSKHLLFALPNGAIVELPKAFLDPRRSLFPSQEMREEGIIPYAPELPIPHENVINYNQSAHRISKIYTAPTGLESTCLVLAYGLDLFSTRVTPSRTFDVLKDDFDHWLIVTVLSALLIFSYLTKKLAARKTLNQAWK